MIDLVDTTRGRFGVQVTGDGPSLFFVAGLGDDHSSWQMVTQEFPRYRCVTFDNRGIGSSPITPGPYTVRALAEDAHAIHQALGLEPVIGIGSSMGGAICQEWALAYPDDLTKLVLTNTWAEPQPFSDVLFEHWQALASRGLGIELLDSLLLFCLSPDFLEKHPEAVAEFRRTPIPDLRGFHAAASACRAHDTAARLGDIRQPTLVIGASFDILVRPELSKRLAAGLPDAQLRWVDAGHFITAEVVDAWNAVLREWLSR